MPRVSDFPRAGRREWLGLIALALPCLLCSMDFTVLNLAVPRLTTDLSPSSAELLWIMDIYGFVLAGALITMGTLGDKIGRRRLLMLGAAAFGAASLFAAFATSAPMLIGARALLGLAAATLAPSTLSLIRNMFHHPQERTFAISMWVASFSVGGAIGPLVGGVLLTYFWWGSVFLIAVPVMVLLLIAAPLLLPEFKDENAGKLDIPSASLSLVAVLAVIYGIKRFAETGIDVIACASIFTGLLLGWVFVRRQRALANPLMDLSLFRYGAFRTSLLVNVLTCFVVFGAFLFVAQYLQLVFGLSPLAAGIWSAPSGLAFIIGSLITGTLVKRWHPAQVMAAGLLVAAAGFALLAQAGAERNLALLVLAFTLFSLGLGPVFTLTTDLVVGIAPPERAGIAAGMAETSIEFGGALGIALQGSLLTAVYRGSLAARAPDNLDEFTLSHALDSLGGALAEAANLPPVPAAELAEVARSAYISGFLLVIILCALIALGAGIISFVLLRRLPIARVMHT